VFERAIELLQSAFLYLVNVRDFVSRTGGPAQRYALALNANCIDEAPDSAIAVARDGVISIQQSTMVIVELRA
jgi:hypothetical protein